MADENDIITNLDQEGPLPNGADTAPAAGIISQYVKDLSVAALIGKMLGMPGSDEVKSELQRLLGFASSSGVSVP